MEMSVTQPAFKGMLASPGCISTALLLSLVPDRCRAALRAVMGDLNQLSLVAEKRKEVSKTY